ncbi:MAG: CDGSH iron-sulfur domain-containing protein [Gemmatimonadota bacterium]|nr:CDGSH iron-sulfur domain-containing protein [Gemmatimonadota bacterium]
MSDQPVRITIKPSGSILIESPAVILDAAGHEIPQPTQKRPGTVKLCGCGRSKGKPFCDGSHNEGR